MNESFRSRIDKFIFPQDVTPTPELPILDTPFKVRTHRLFNLYGLEYAHTPKSLVREIKTTAFQKPDKWYAQDCFGNSSQSTIKVERDQIEVYKEYVALPNSYPMLLVADQPDRICDTVVVGQHCRFPSHDVAYMNQILRFARQNLLMYYVTIYDGKSEGSYLTATNQTQLILAKGTMRILMKNLLRIRGN